MGLSLSLFLAISPRLTCVIDIIFGKPQDLLIRAAVAAATSHFEMLAHIREKDIEHPIAGCFELLINCLEMNNEQRE
jgi:hypothetical protein